VFEDDNLCNGTLYCDEASGFCLVNEATIPKCSGPGEGPCKPEQCDPKDGTCKALPLPTTATCDTDDFACTVERCDGKGGCAYVGEGCLCWEGSDCDPWEDGDACNGTLYCEKWAGPETDKPGACK
jgi:hypothetical protein